MRDCAKDQAVRGLAPAVSQPAGGGAPDSVDPVNPRNLVHMLVSAQAKSGAATRWPAWCTRTATRGCASAFREVRASGRLASTSVGDHMLNVEEPCRPQPS